MSRTVLCLSRGSSKIGIPISDVVRAGTYRKEGSPFAEEAYYDGKGDRPDRETNCGDVSYVLSLLPVRRLRWRWMARQER